MDVRVMEESRAIFRGIGEGKKSCIRMLGVFSKEAASPDEASPNETLDALTARDDNRCSVDD